MYNPNDVHTAQEIAQERYAPLKDRNRGLRHSKSQTSLENLGRWSLRKKLGGSLIWLGCRLQGECSTW
jgi:hypothetical protein